MPEKITPISRAISDVLTGKHKKKRLTQEEFAERAGMSIWTLQKKLKGRAPITATDLVVLSQAIGISPSEVLEEALDDLSKASEGLVSLDAHRDKKPSEMTDDELEGEQSAANTDTQHEEDEPENT